MPFDAFFEPLPPSDVQLLLAAKALIRVPYLWLQGGYMVTVDGVPRHCTVAALAVICGNINYWRPTPRERKLINYLVSELPRSKLSWLPARTRLILFNDRKGTAHADVMALFDRAITRCRQAITL